MPEDEKVEIYRNFIAAVAAMRDAGFSQELLKVTIENIYPVGG